MNHLKRTEMLIQLVISQPKADRTMLCKQSIFISKNARKIALLARGFEIRKRKGIVRKSKAKVGVNKKKGVQCGGESFW
jgi:hypothetical protein